MPSVLVHQLEECMKIQKTENLQLNLPLNWLQTLQMLQVMNFSYCQLRYYNATFDKITIPAGSFFGKLRVNLTDAFFADPLTTGLHYVIPLRITDAAGDSILKRNRSQFSCFS